MRKAVIIATATAFLGSTLAPVPANAMFFLMPFFLAAKVDPNWGKAAATKPEPKKKVAKMHSKKKKKRA